MANDVEYVPTPVPVLFPTLASAGYTACTHGRLNLAAPMQYCRDCGHSDAQDGSLDFQREPHYL